MLLKSLSKIMTRKTYDTQHSFNQANLTFSILNDKLNAPLEFDGPKYRVIGSNGPTTLYLFDLGQIGTEEANLMNAAKAHLIDSIMDRNALSWDKNELARLAQKIAESFISGTQWQQRAKSLAYPVLHDTILWGPISMLLDDSSDIEEIEINSPTQRIVVYHRRYGRCITNLRFNSELDFRYTINKMIGEKGKELGQASQIIDAQVGNCRIHAQTKPYAISGGSASIRVAHEMDIGIKELMQNKTITPCEMAYLWMAIEAGKNIVIAGAPGSGKTTMLAALSSFLPANRRIITIEEGINEIRLNHSLNYVLQLQSGSSGIGIGEQIRNALHMRPEMLIIGEIRGSEANDAFSGANVGVPFMTTMHSDGGGAELLSRLISKPMNLEEQLINRLNVSVFMRKSEDGTRRVENISEYEWHEGNPAGQPSISTIASFSKMNLNAAKGSQAAAKSLPGKTDILKELEAREAHLIELLSGDTAIDPSVHVRGY